MRAKSVSSSVSLGLIYKGADVDIVSFKICPPVLGKAFEFGGTYREEVSVILEKDSDKLVSADFLLYGEDECFDSYSLLSNAPIDNTGEFLEEAVKLRDTELSKCKELEERTD